MLICAVYDVSHRDAQTKALCSALDGDVIDYSEITDEHTAAPDVIIGCGASVVEQILQAKAGFAAKPFAISILDPLSRHDEFDLIICPSYESHYDGENVVETTGILNRITDAMLENMRQRFAEFREIAELKAEKKYAVLLGGRHVGGNLVEGDAVALASKLNAQKNACFWISSCARTEDAFTKKFLDMLEVPYVFFDYRKRIFKSHDMEIIEKIKLEDVQVKDKQQSVRNPYLAMLANCDAVVVTGDSVRMISEACSVKKPVWIYDSKNIFFGYKPLHAELHEKNYARNIDMLDDFNSDFLEPNEVQRVAELVKSMFDR